MIRSWSRFIASFARINASIPSTRHLPEGSSTSKLCLATSSKLPTPKTSPRQSRTPKSVFRYKLRKLAHCSGVSASGKSGRERCAGCKSANAFCMRIRFCSLNRQQISTSRVTSVTPCATAAKPPTNTNSTWPAISRRVSSLRFCISFSHRRPQRLGKIQRVVIGLHPFPRRLREALFQ